VQTGWIAVESQSGDGLRKTVAAMLSAGDSREAASAAYTLPGRERRQVYDCRAKRPAYVLQLG
jgi:hypothetical protein